MKNKKILGALAALCMGIILCVSSVFAVNYWYTITNNNEETAVSTGKAITLDLSKGVDAEDGLYPGGYVTFETITVVAPKWDAPTAGVNNVTLPTFNVKITKVETKKDSDLDWETVTAEDGFADQFVVYSKVNDDTAFTKIDKLATDDTVTANLYVATDIQAENDGANFDLTIRLSFVGADESGIVDDMYASHTLRITIEIVALVDGVEVQNPDATQDALDPTVA